MYLVNIFYDVNGNFQWVSMTALAALIVGIIGPFISIYNNKKTLEKQEQMNISNFKGNVVAKARIEWIQEVRTKSVDFMSASYNLVQFIQSNDDFRNLDGETEKELNRLKDEVQKNGNLLILYFGPDSNKNNDLIVYLVTSIVEPLTTNSQWYTIIDATMLADKIMALKDFLRIYLKAEWKRANGEIDELNLQDYLEKHKAYVKIMEIFSSHLKKHEKTIDKYYKGMPQRL
ncbi:hypothetical protein [Bacillus sp. K2I17]|uniref:hypothetical protein n=1 Tax=Bacillus sp. K2I17 TaxID=2014743 RepID=UPI000B515648|nr:hypothetical protein [Bacillus sp. K2I17]OWT52692.1 hypothetical protein CER22_00050 [Bacillus sp. K2I17]